MTPDERNKLIGERVRFHRTAKEISLAEMAERLGDISHQQLAKYETGQCRWPATLLCAIARELRIDVRKLADMLPERTRSEYTDEEWEAERYKEKLVAAPLKVRRVLYRIIDCIIKI